MTSVNSLRYLFQYFFYGILKNKNLNTLSKEITREREKKKWRELFLIQSVMYSQEKGYSEYRKVKLLAFKL